MSRRTVHRNWINTTVRDWKNLIFTGPQPEYFDEHCYVLPDLLHLATLERSLPMKVPDKPDNEVRRMAVLDALHILDTESEEIFDRIVQVAALCLDVPMAIISLVDDDRQWFKARQGLALEETSRDISFCGHTILGEGSMVVPDASRDPRFHDNPLVVGEPNIAFYAGYPLELDDVSIGTLCVLGSKPRAFGQKDIELLEALGWMVERELEQRKSRLTKDRQSGIKTNFIAQLGHELRTPTNALLGSLGLAKRAASEGRDTGHFIDLAEGAARQVEGLLEDVVDLSQAESDDFEPYITKFDLDALIKRFAQQGRLNSEAQHLDFFLVCDLPLPNAVLGDEKRVGKVISSLISNAILYTDSGHIELSVACTPTVDTGKMLLQVEVSDTGSSVGEETLVMLFEPFHRGESARRVAPDGVGLGLAVSRSIAECLGGTLDIISNEPGAVAFRFELELELEQPGAERFVDTSSQAQNSGPVRLLIVEDSPTNRAVIEAMLKELHCEVWIAPDGEQAVELATTQQFDIVLMDIGLPGIDGYECVRQLRELPVQVGARVIAVTAQAVKGDRDQMLASGFNEYLPKPFSRLELISAIEHQGWSLFQSS